VSKSGALADPVPASLKVVRLQWRSDAGWEDEVVFLPVGPGVGTVGLLAFLMGLEGLDADLRERHRSLGVLDLGRDEAQLSTDAL
jgi:hypothetical protein